MPNTKKISIAVPGIGGTGLTVYAIVRREADGYLMSDADGSFASGPADPYLSLAEHATIKGLYEASESRAAWNDGRYSVVAYEQAGGSPAPASDYVIGGGQLYIVSDTEVVLDASVAARATPADIAGAFGEGVLQSSVAVLNGDPQTMVRGDVKTLSFSLGTGWPLTGKKAYFIAQADPTAANTTAIVNRECTVTDAAAGECEITLTTTETAIVGSYYAELEVRDSDGAGNPMTALQFRLRVVQDVRQ